MEVLDATIALQGAHFGMIGLLDPGKKTLEIVVQRGFDERSLERFLSGPIYAGIASGRSMQGHQSVIIEDVETEPGFAEHRAAALAAGFRAVQATPLVSSSGDVLGMVATHFRQPHRPPERELRMTDLYARQAANMVERRRAEQRLRRSEANLAEGQRMSQTASWAWNAITQELYWSAEHYRIWGLEPRSTPIPVEEALRYIHPEDLPAMERHFYQAVQDKRDFEYDARVVRPDGEVRNIRCKGRPVCDDSGALLEYVGTVIDTTERRHAEEKLRESTQQLQLILSSIPYKFFAVSKDWRYTYLNKHAAAQIEALGMDPRRLIGKVLWDVFPQVPNEANIRRVMNERVPVTDELYYPPLGEWVENNMYPSPDGGIVIFQRYVTERKRAEEALRRSEAYLAEGQRISQTGSWAWNPASGAIFWSAEHFRIFGLEPRAQAPSHKEMLERVHPDDRPAFVAKFQAAVSTRTDYVMDCRIVRPDGRLRYVQSRARPVFDDSGVLTEYVGTIIDTTERREAEAKLQESEHRFRELAEAIPHHVWTYRRDGSVGYHNRRLVDYTGLSEGQLARSGWDALHPEDLQRNRAVWAERWEKGGDYEVEERIRGRDGVYRRFISRAVPVYGAQGEIVEWFGTDTPIEERKLAEEAAQKARDELAHVNRALTVAELTASIAHELNQPLAAVVTNANACERWLAGPAPNIEEAHQGLRRIARDANRASQVIARIRGLLTRHGSQRSELAIADVIAEVVSIIEGETRAKGVTMTIAVQHGLAPVMADRVQIQQVLLNLLLNAIDAMNAVVGPRMLEVRAEARAGELVVSVQDSGAGLQAKSVERIFEPFFTTKREGMGMGLAISRSIVEAHGGKMRAMSNSGAGATFEFTLPFPAKGAPYT
jgi:PAS domain S-box-containing protein